MSSDRIFLAIFIAFLSACNLFSAIAATGTNGNKSDDQIITDACKAAKEKNCNILLKFSAKWCPWCVNLKKISQEKPLAEALKKFELVELDVGDKVMVNGKKQYKNFLELMQKYSPEVFIPQMIVLDCNGKVISRLNPDDYESKDQKGNDPEKLAKILLKCSITEKQPAGK
ncbi:MAG: hypothetical protein HQM08_06940 [Candidatus Riflebacteria bacterium]|nr:hypothetical protein [Candidatus Riflebacteria bacterium]